MGEVEGEIEGEIEVEIEIEIEVEIKVEPACHASLRLVNRQAGLGALFQESLIIFIMF
jgi:hypothetical protein